MLIPGYSVREMMKTGSAQVKKADFVWYVMLAMLVTEGEGMLTLSLSHSAYLLCLLAPV
jgi:hypothetical protein